ncbi:MAG: type II toxin-antitoxin system HicA family toxin [Pseudonocardiaceae bacterium]
MSFDDLVRLVRALGFREVGGKGSHRVFAHPRLSELVTFKSSAGRPSVTKSGRSGAWYAVMICPWRMSDESWLSDRGVLERRR